MASMNMLGVAVMLLAITLIGFCCKSSCSAYPIPVPPSSTIIWNGTLPVYTEALYVPTLEPWVELESSRPDLDLYSKFSEEITRVNTSYPWLLSTLSSIHSTGLKLHLARSIIRVVETSKSLSLRIQTAAMRSFPLIRQLGECIFAAFLIGLAFVLNLLATVIEYIVSFMENALMYYVYATILCGFRMAWHFPKRSLATLTALCTYSWATSQSPWRLMTFLWTRPISWISMIIFRVSVWALYILMAPLRLLLPRKARMTMVNQVMTNGCECTQANCTCKGWKVATVEALMPNFHSVAIPTTRKKNVVAFTYADGSHCGYGSFVTLTSGRRGLATVKHVWDAMLEHTGFVEGRKGKVPVNIFKPLYDCPAGDMIILTTSKYNMNWSSPVGVKACKMLPITQVSFGTHRLEFANEKGMWFTQTCCILGRDEFLLRIRSNTEAGFSGLPIYDNKGRVVALHQGNVRDQVEGTVENRAAFILDIPGITGPLIIPGFESVYEDKRVLHGTTIDTGDFDLCDVEISGKRVIVKVSATSQYKPTWKPTLTGKVKGPSWDDADDDDYDEYLDQLVKQYGLESSSPPPSKAGKDPATEIGELKAEIERLRMALRIKVQESSPPETPLKEEPQTALGNQSGKQEKKAATAPPKKKTQLTEEEQKERNRLKNKARRERVKARRAAEKEAALKPQKAESPPKKTAPKPEVTKVDKDDLMSKIATQLDVGLLQKEIIKYFTEQKPLMRKPPLKHNSRGTTTSKPPPASAQKKPQQASNGQANVEPSSTQANRVASPNGEKLELRPHYGSGKKWQVSGGPNSAPKRN